MLNSRDSLDAVFHALSVPARRAILLRLSKGQASVSDLAAPLDMTLAAVVQHVQALENSGLVKTTKTGRVRSCELNPRALHVPERWLSERRAQWEAHLGRLGDVLQGFEAEKRKRRSSG